MRTIAVINQKGGCGKTTTAINLASAMAGTGARALLVDMDPQSHCALGLAIPESQIVHSVADVLVARPGMGHNWNEMIWQVSSGLDLLPSTMKLAAAEYRLAGAADRDLKLARALAQIESRYDVCVIDCPPNIGLLTFNALRAAGEVLIPVEIGYFSLSGAIRQAATLQVLADRVQHEVVFYILPTMFDAQTPIANQIVAELKANFKDRVLDLMIDYDVAFKEAAGRGQPIAEYAPQSDAAFAFARLATHLLSTKPTTGRLASATAAAEIVESATQCAADPEHTAAASITELCHSQRTHDTLLDLDEPVAAESPEIHAGIGSGNDRLADLLRRTQALATRAH